MAEDEGTKTTAQTNTTQSAELDKLDAGTLVKMIGDLREENANRRITNRDLNDAKTKVDEQIKQLTDKLSDFESKTTRLAELEKYKTEIEEIQSKKKQEEMTENEKLKDILTKRESQLTEKEKSFKKKLEELQKESIEKDVVINEKDAKLNELRIEGIVSDITLGKDFKFRSAYEKQGLLSEVLVKNETGTYISDDEVKEIVTKFCDDNFKSPDAPPGDKQTRTQSGSIEAEMVEYQELRNRHVGRQDLDDEEKKRMVELGDKFLKRK
jgi:hypothetical protein